MNKSLQVLDIIYETTAQISSFASKSGKSEAEVERLWQEIKAKLKEDGIEETEKKFYPILVSILKKKLGGI